MNRIMIAALGAAAVASMPALAMQQNDAKQPAKAKQATRAAPHTVHGEMMLYQDTNYNGDSYAVDGPSSTVRTDWNIRSLTIHPGDRWQICARSRFRDPCIVLDRSVHDATLIGVEGQIGSARMVDDIPIPD